MTLSLPVQSLVSAYIGSREPMKTTVGANAALFRIRDPGDHRWLEVVEVGVIDQHRSGNR